MTDSNPFFRFIWRANALVIFALALTGAIAFALLLGAEVFSHFRDRPIVSDFPPDPEAKQRDGATEEPRVETQIGIFQPSNGRFFASLVRASAREASVISRSKTNYDALASNLMFFDPATGVTKRLFPDDDGLIVSQTILSEAGPTDGQVRALLLAYVVADTDGDAKLSDGDAQRILLVRPDGSASTVIADGVDALDSSWRADGSSKLHLFTRKGEEVRYAEADLDSFAVKPGKALSAKR